MSYIAFASQAGHGKNVLADYLVSRLGSPWRQCGFAEAVKKVYQDAFNVDRDFIEKWKRIDEPPPGMLMNVRQGLQFIGDGFRKIKSDIWIEIALRGKNLVIYDMRYHNEARHIRECGGISVVLYRPGFLNNDPNPSESQIRPVMEWCAETQEDGPILWRPRMPEDVKLYDFFLRNDGTLEDLYGKVDRLLVPYINGKF